MITQTDNPEKARQILEAAQKRFGLYGVEKTSMREIAEDLNLSKGSLYYYFPDKEHLYMAVVEHEHGQFISRLKETLSNTEEPEEILAKYVEARLLYFRSLLNLSRLRVETYKGLKPLMQGAWIRFNEVEIGIISEIIRKGTEKGTFFCDNHVATAGLYLDVLRGLRQNVLKPKETMYINEEEFSQLVTKAGDFTKIFVRGLKYNDNSNK